MSGFEHSGGELTAFGHATTLGGSQGGTNLADVLERVLDKGVVIAGDIQINLLDIELLTIKLRLVIASVDTARRMGISWWETDPSASNASSVSWSSVRARGRARHDRDGSRLLRVLHRAGR
jgi:hypothetical protein